MAKAKTKAKTKAKKSTLKIKDLKAKKSVRGGYKLSYESKIR